MTANSQLSYDEFAEPDYIADGELVNAKTIYPIIRQLYLNDLAVKSTLDHFHIPSALLAWVEVDSSAKVGQPVYYSSVTDRYELAAFQTTMVGDTAYLDATGEIWGLVVEKTAADAAYILVDGIYKVDLSAATGTSTNEGRLYLGDTPGELVSDPSDVQFPVYACTSLANGYVLFRPSLGENNGLVFQWRHSLSNAAAGTIVVTDDTLEITSPDDALEGWLPADHASFGGNAPAGAAFGYNLPQDADLADRWPPRFLGSTYLEIYRDSSASVGGVSVPIGPEGLCVVDENNLWWMSSCVDDAPFITGTVPDTGADACPTQPDRQVILYTLRPSSLAADIGNALTSSSPALKWTKTGTTQTASQGELTLSLVPPSLLDTNPDDGTYAVIGADSSSLVRGPTVRSLVAGSGISLTSDNTVGSGQFGDVTVAASAAAEAELLPLTTALWSATEERLLNTLAIGLPGRRSSGITSSFQIPGHLSGTLNLEFYLWTMAEFVAGSGTAASESLTLTVLPMATPGAGGTDLSSLSSSTPSLPLIEQEHRIVRQHKSAVFTASPGSLIFVRLDRAAADITHSLHVLKHFLKLVP